MIVDYNHAGLWLAGSFFRSLEWRWERAHHLTESGRKPDKRVDDEWVCSTLDWLQSDRDMQTPIGAAFRHREAGGTRIQHLQAYLLSDLSVEDVASRFDLPSVHVEAYEKLFFGVRDRMKGRDWITITAIRQRAKCGTTAERMASVWRLVAYHFGSVALEIIMSATSIPDELPPGIRVRHVEPGVIRKARLFAELLMLPADVPLAQLLDLQERGSAVFGSTRTTSDDSGRELNQQAIRQLDDAVRSMACESVS